MKLMIVGQWQYEVYEEAFGSALSHFGVEIIPFKLSMFFQGKWSSYRRGLPVLDVFKWRLNRAVINLTKECHPDYVLFWRPTHIIPQTLICLSDLGVRTISYNNDDPFGPFVLKNVPWHHHFLWLSYLKCLPFFDQNYFYRKINVDEAYLAGAKAADILLPYFLPEKDCPVQLNENEKKLFACDVVFVGHYEPDGREKAISALLNSGIHLKIWGGNYWTPKVLGAAHSQLSPIRRAEGQDYAKALCGAKICLAFLSKLNRDTYTRRCFEIPACGRVMLAERTDDLTRMFKEDVEACFFSSDEELLLKVRWLLDNPVIRERIASAGLRRVWMDGHDVRSRALDFIEKIKISSI